MHFGLFLLYLFQVGPVDVRYLPDVFKDEPTNNAYVINTGGLVHLTRKGVTIMREWKIGQEDHDKLNQLLAGNKPR